MVDAQTELEPVVKNYLAAFKVDARVGEWLLAEGIYDCESIASIAATEELVDSRFIQPLISAGVESLKKLGQAIAITKLWRKRRTQLEECEAKAKALVKVCSEKAERPHTEDQEIPTAEAKTISEAWDTRHGFTLTDSQILTPFQQGRLWREGVRNGAQDHQLHGRKTDENAIDDKHANGKFGFDNSRKATGKCRDHR